MKIFAISDLHLSAVMPKPMNIFGAGWEGYLEKITANWQENITDDDLVLISGDISWAMKYSDAMPDLEFIASLKGTKVLLRGNHDYWWKSISSMRATFPKSIFAIQNDCLRFDNVLVCGTRGWTVPEDNGGSDEDKKLYQRETERLKLSLSCMQQQRREGDFVVSMIHFPPFNSRYERSNLLQLFEDFRIDVCVYGHLHGKKSRSELYRKINGIDYYLTSCDKLDHEPLLIKEI